MALPRSAPPLTVPEAAGPVDGEAPMCREDFELPAHPAAVTLAREKIGELARHCEIPPDLEHAAQLVISEFFTNSVLHSESGRIRCLLHICADRLRIEVEDEGGGSDVEPRDAEHHEVNGRGLQLVSAVADQWGVADGGPQEGRMVWAEMGFRRP